MRPGEAPPPTTPALSDEDGGGGGSTNSQEHPGPPSSPPRTRAEARSAGAAPASPISRASCRRAPRRRRGALLGPRPQQIAAVLQYPRTLAPRHWHRLGLGNSCTVPMVTRQRLLPPPAPLRALPTPPHLLSGLLAPSLGGLLPHLSAPPHTVTLATVAAALRRRLKRWPPSPRPARASSQAAARSQPGKAGAGRKLRLSARVSSVVSSKPSSARLTSRPLEIFPRSPCPSS